MNHSSSVLRELKVFLAATPWIFFYFISDVLQDHFQFGGGLKVVVALLPIPAFVFFLFFVVWQIRRLDELNRRVHLEALAIAFPLSILLLMTLGLLQKASPLSWGYGEVWFCLPFFYLIGLLFAWRRYR